MSKLNSKLATLTLRQFLKSYDNKNKMSISKRLSPNDPNSYARPGTLGLKSFGTLE